jgi:hypothetical protein
MKNFAMAFTFALSSACIEGMSACDSGSAGGGPNPIVGTWLVKDSGAPFPYHMYVFNADGTLQQANPDAGDPRTSDSDGKGVWRNNGDSIKCKWMEIVADRTTHKYAGRTEIACDIKVSSNTFTGTESVSVFDINGTLIEPGAAPMQVAATSGHPLSRK